MNRLVERARAGERVHVFYPSSEEAAAAFHAWASRLAVDDEALARVPVWTISFASGGCVVFDQAWASPARLSLAKIDVAVGVRNLRSKRAKMIVNRKALHVETAPA